MSSTLEGGGCRNCIKLRNTVKELRRENLLLKKKLESIESYAQTFGWIRPNQTKTKGKKPGQKRGHMGTSKTIPEQIDETVKVTLKKCPDCGNSLKKPFSVRSRYVWDVPPPTTVKVTEYQLQRYWCSCCRKNIEAKTDTLPYFRLGIGVWSWAYVMHHRLNISFDKIMWWMQEVWQLPITKGALTQGLDSIGKQLTPAYDSMMQNLRDSRYAHADETGCRVDGINWWTWIFRTKNQIVYHSERSRAGEVPKRILGKNYKGVMVTDDYTAYNKLNCKKQACWVHLIRKARDLTEKKKPHPEHHKLHRTLQRIFHEIKEYQKEPPPPQERQTYYQLFEGKLNRVIKGKYKTQESKTIAKRIQRRLPQYLTCILEPDIPSHNNPAEQGLRHQVTHRKVSNLRSAKSAKTHDILNTLLNTRLQKTPNPLEATRQILTQITTTY
jgi:transposase